MKTIPFSKDRLEEIISKYPTPFHIYDEKSIREKSREFYKAFSWVPGNFNNYFAVKALPNPHILQILKEEGMGADCSSLPELIIAEKCGITGDNIMFSSNNTLPGEFLKARELGAIINLDDISHIDFLEKEAGIPDKICFRYNPGKLKEGNPIIGKPLEAKYGLTENQIFEAYRIMKEKGVKSFGLHTMIASNELDPEYFIETAAILFDLALEIAKKLKITLSFINLGGGLGIPYRPEEKNIDLLYISKGIEKLYKEKLLSNGLDKIRIVMESGRMITGPSGYLVSRVIHIKKTYKTFIGLDSSAADLMRPGIYGAYHHITIPGKKTETTSHIYDITGSLCENNDKFAIDRNLPEISIGDLVVIHDTGAHGHAMGFNYNGKLRPAELLLESDGSVRQIRRAETVDDYFATINFKRKDE